MERFIKNVKISALTFAVSSSMIFAQSIEEGRKLFTYEKYDSAKAVFEKNTSPEGIYWLGQTLLRLKTPKEQVRTLFQNGVQANPKSELLQIGLSQMDILDGKIAEAKTVQSAILNKSKDIELFNATARAQLSSKDGDVDFVLQKLLLAKEFNKKKNADLPIFLAKTYLRKANTSDATYALIDAADFAPNSAEPIYNRAKMYNFKLDENNKSRYLEFMNKTITKDPNYAPAYYDLFYLYFADDKTKALEYFSKYQNLADKTPELEYINANVSYNIKDYAKAIELSQKIISRDGENTDPRYYKVLAHSNLDTNNLTEAGKYLNLYLAKVKKEDINYGDYLEAAKISLKLGDEATFKTMMENALTLAENNGERYNVAQVAIPIYREKMEANKANQTLAIPYQTELAKWLEINYKNHHKPTNVDLYNFGVENFSLKNWAKTDEAFSLYAQKFPEQIQGFYFVGIANTKDALNNPAKSLEFFTKATEVGMLNPADSKYFLNQSFYALIKNAMDNKDTAKAKEYASKILTYDPANANANSVLK